MFRLAFILALLSAPAFAQETTLTGTDGKNALGKIPCATAAGETLRSCHAELRHHDDGTTTLAVAMGNGEVRSIYFNDGVPNSSSSASKLTYETRGDLVVVFIDPSEVYEVPKEALIRQ